MNKKIFLQTACFLTLSLSAEGSLEAAASISDQQNEIYRSFRSHLNMGKTVEAAKLFVAEEFNVSPDTAAEEYFTVKFYRMNETWGSEIKERIREALTTRKMEAEEIENFTVNENFASFSYIDTRPEAVPEKNSLPVEEANPRDTAHLIADAVFADVPEIDLLRIVIQYPGKEGEIRAEKFDFMKQV